MDCEVYVGTKQVQINEDDCNIKVMKSAVSENYKYYSVVLVIIQTVNSLFGAGFSFYELTPALQCKNSQQEWTSCSKSEACTDYSEFKVDWSSDYSINNMMTK